MKLPWQLAHERLMATLPVRTHLRREPPPPPPPAISRREATARRRAEIRRLVAEGKTFDEIAAALDISVMTVRNYLYELRKEEKGGSAA